MIIVELTYKKPLEEVNKFLEGHRNFLDKYYDSGLFLVSGPKEPRDGGIIIALTDQASMEDLLKNDPFYQNDLADYRIIHFVPSKYGHQLKSLFDLV